MAGAWSTGRRATRYRVGRVLQAVLLAAVVVAVFVVILPKFTDLSKVWSAIRSMTGLEYGLLIVATGWNILTYWPVAMAALPGLSLGQAAVVTQSSTSVAMTVPGGGAIAVAVSYAMYRSWGFRRSQIALVTLVTGIWNTFIKLAIPVVALLSLNLVFGASLRFVCIPERQLSWEEIFAVWAFLRLATTAPIIPGNVGLAELGYIGGLVLLGGGRAEVVAGVLVYRFLTY